MVTLHRALAINASSCLVFGTVFLLFPSAVAAFVNSDNTLPTIIVTLLGFGLSINGLALAWASRLAQPQIGYVWFFSAGDLLWAAVTTALVIAQIGINTVHGSVFTLVVAAGVAALGLIQLNSSR